MIQKNSINPTLKIIIQKKYLENIRVEEYIKREFAKKCIIGSLMISTQRNRNRLATMVDQVMTEIIETRRSK